MSFRNWCMAFLGIVVYYGLMVCGFWVVVSTSIGAITGMAMGVGSFMRHLIVSYSCNSPLDVVPSAVVWSAVGDFALYGLSVGCLGGAAACVMEFEQHRTELAQKPRALRRLDCIAGDALLAAIVAVMMLPMLSGFEERVGTHPRWYNTMCPPLMCSGEMCGISAYYWNESIRRTIDEMEAKRLREVK